jgi:hypothetical protein
MEVGVRGIKVMESDISNHTPLYKLFLDITESKVFHLRSIEFPRQGDIKLPSQLGVLASLYCFYDIP